MDQPRVEAVPFDPEDLAGLRARIDAETGGGYARFRNGLAPDYGRIRRNIAGGYAALAAVVCATGLIGPFAMPAGALLIGFTVAYLQLFMHEAAHFGLARDRASNDRLANLLICWQVGTRIAAYRTTHWEHHRWLGEAKDTEVSYRNRLSRAFLVSLLTGVHALRVSYSRENAPSPVNDRERAGIGPMLVGGAVHGAILALLIFVGWWSAAVAWVVGMVVVFPFFAAMRQLLEHRPAAGHPEMEAITRLFGDGPFARLFGGAGFNRHMLHHLEPQVSCSRLADLEDFLMATSAKAELDARRSTYWAAFTEILRNDRIG